MSTCALRIPRETSEFLPLSVTVDGLPTDIYEVSLSKGLGRPETWTPAVVQGAEHGVILTGLTKGDWNIWVRVLGTIVEHVDTITVT